MDQLPQSAVPDGGAVKRALIADDDATLVRFTEILLRREGFVVESVGEGDQIVDAALRFRPDVLILDILMPKLHGYQALRELREHPQCADVKVLVCSVLSEREYILKAFSEGADDFIAKPFEPEDFLLRVLKLTMYSDQGQVVGLPNAAEKIGLVDWFRLVAKFYRSLIRQLEAEIRARGDLRVLHDTLDLIEGKLEKVAVELAKSSPDNAGIQKALSEIHTLVTAIEKKG